MCLEPGPMGIRGQRGGRGWFRGPCLDLWCGRGNNTYIMSPRTNMCITLEYSDELEIFALKLNYTNWSNNVQISTVTNCALPWRCDSEVGSISILAVGRATYRRLEQICPYAHGDSCKPRGWRGRKCFGAAFLRLTHRHTHLHSV